MRQSRIETGARLAHSGAESISAPVYSPPLGGERVYTGAHCDGVGGRLNQHLAQAIVALTEEPRMSMRDIRQLEQQLRQLSPDERFTLLKRATILRFMIQTIDPEVT